MKLRLALLCLLFFTGCRLTGVASARREVVSDALQTLRFPVPPEEAAARLRSQRATSRCDVMPSGELRCGACVRGRCFQLFDDQGSSRVVTGPELNETDLRMIWGGIDPQSLAELQPHFEDLVQDKLIEQEARFEPRWGLTAGVLAGLTTETSSLGSVMAGGRIGVRRWFDIHLIGHAAFEYRFKGEHELGVRVGLEVSRWSEGRLWGNVGAPGGSVSLFIGPLLRVPNLRGGLRTGVGFHLTDLRSAPFFIEGAAETIFAGSASSVAGVFTVGIGI